MVEERTPSTSTNPPGEGDLASPPPSTTKQQDEPSEPPVKAAVSDEDSSSSDDDDDDNANETTNGQDALIQAALLKEEGNSHFQKGKWDEAARCYRKGCNRLKKVSNLDADPQVKPLQLTLQTNLSMVLFKQQKYRASRDMASKALSLEPTHVKALYRRAVAGRALGDWDVAKADLRAALAVDKTNVACQRELASLKKQVDQANQKQKSALAKAFASSGSGGGGKSLLLYTDKAQEEEDKKKAKEKQKKEEEQKKQQRKKDWEDECVKRMASGGQAISFEEWETEQEAKEKERKKQEEQEREAERKQRQARRRKQKEEQTQNDNDDDDEEELTEQELASLRGYKKTRDGRTTSYFTRELSDAEKQRLGDMAPKKLESSSTTSAAAAVASTTSSSGTSAWNQAGTWEEKDVSGWCKHRLKHQLSSTTTTTTGSSLTAKIVKVQEVNGEGSVASAGGKKKYIFDFHAKLQYDIVRHDSTVVASGVARLPDICSTHYHDEALEVAFEAWTQEPTPPDTHGECLQARAQLIQGLRQSVQAWVQEFNAEF